MNALLVALFAGTLAASCGGASPSATPPPTLPTGQVSAGKTSTTTSTTTTTTPGPLAECGSQRDPLDPTGSKPPAGSPAIC